MGYEELIDFEKVLPFALFGLFAGAAWWILELLAAGKPRFEQRLDELRYPRRKRKDPTGATGTKKSDAVSRMLEKASPALAKPLQPKTELEADRLRTKMARAGYRGPSATTIFLGFKLIGLITGLILGGAALLITYGFVLKTLMGTVFAGGALFYLPDLFLMLLARGRKQKIFLGLPDALDLLVVCVEAGLGLDQAMNKVSDEMKKSHGVIAEEFSICNFQLQMGRARNEVLREFGTRTGVEDVRSLAATLIQADRFGASIAQALRIQSDAMRTRRRQMAEEKAAKTAVKLLFPLVLFIFPSIFVVLVGPAAINVVNQMLPVLGKMNL